MGPGAWCPQPQGGSSRSHMQPRLQRAEGTRESCDLQIQLISLKGGAFPRVLKETASVSPGSSFPAGLASHRHPACPPRPPAGPTAH